MDFSRFLGRNAPSLLSPLRMPFRHSGWVGDDSRKASKIQSFARRGRILVVAYETALSSCCAVWCAALGWNTVTLSSTVPSTEKVARLTAARTASSVAIT